MISSDVKNPFQINTAENAFTMTRISLKFKMFLFPFRERESVFQYSSYFQIIENQKKTELQAQKDEEERRKKNGNTECG